MKLCLQSIITADFCVSHLRGAGSPAHTKQVTAPEQREHLEIGKTQTYGFSPILFWLFPKGGTTEQSTAQGNMFTEAKKRAELFLPAHHGPLVQCGFLQHVNVASSTAKNIPSDACGGAGDGCYPQPYPHKVKSIPVRALCDRRHLSTWKKHKGDDDQTRKEILSFRSSFFFLVIKSNLTIY